VVAWTKTEKRGRVCSWNQVGKKEESIFGIGAFGHREDMSSSNNSSDNISNVSKSEGTVALDVKSAAKAVVGRFFPETVDVPGHFDWWVDRLALAMESTLRVLPLVWFLPAGLVGVTQYLCDDGEMEGLLHVAEARLAQNREAVGRLRAEWVGLSEGTKGFLRAKILGRHVDVAGNFWDDTIKVAADLGMQVLRFVHGLESVGSSVVDRCLCHDDLMDVLLREAEVRLVEGQNTIVILRTLWVGLGGNAKSILKAMLEGRNLF
jgi:hypothetical protein